MKNLFTLLFITLVVSNSQSQNCGPFDPTFGTAGKTFSIIATGSGNNPESENLIIQPDNKILQPISIYSGSHYNFGLIRYKSNGLLDSAFGTNGIIITSVGSGDCLARSGAIQADGKIVVAGTAVTPGGSWGFGMIRYKNNGTVDSSFGLYGRVLTAMGSGYDQPSSLTIQPDGKILIVGTSLDYTYYAGAIAIARFKDNGSLDSTFGQNGKIITHIGPKIDYIGNLYYGRYGDENAKAVLVQTDGKIIVTARSYVAAGCYDYYGGIYCNAAFAMVRLQTDGTIDSSFGINGKIVDSVNLLYPETAILQTDEKIVVTGSGSQSGFITERFNINGIPDSSFGTNGIVFTKLSSNSWGKSMAIRPDNKIIVAGSTYSYSYSVQDFVVLRYNSNGTPDNTFNGNGIAVFHVGQAGSYDEATGVGMQDNKIIIGGFSRTNTSGSIAIARLLENGQTLSPIINASGPLSFCIGNSVRLSVNDTGTIQWYKNDLPISGAIDTILIANTSGSYKATVSNTNGCGSSSPVLVAVTTPFLPIITANGPTNLCIGNSVVLTSNSYGGNQWFRDGVAISGAINNSLTVATTGIYTLEITVNGCEAVSNPITITINTIIPAAPVINAGGPTMFCNGSSVVLTSAANSNNQWYKNGVIINGGTSANLDVTTTGKYTAKVIESGCESAVSNEILVTVNNNPAKPPITWNTPEFSTTAGYAHYQWSLNNVAIAGVDNNVYKPLQTGLYNVLVTDNNDCKNTSDNFNLVLLAVSDITIGDSKLRYYPNPAQTVLHIDISNSILNKLKAELYDQLGRLVHTQLLNQSHNEMALQKLSAGIYQLVIHDMTKRVSVKLIVTR